MKTPRYSIRSVQSLVASGYYSTVIDNRFNKVVFCSTISSFRDRKLGSSEAQAIRKIDELEKQED